MKVSFQKLGLGSLEDTELHAKAPFCIHVLRYFGEVGTQPMKSVAMEVGQ